MGKSCRKLHPPVRWRAATCRDFHRFPTISIPISSLPERKRKKERTRREKKRREERTHTRGKGREEGRVIPKIWNNGIKEDIGDRKFDQPVLGSGSNPLNFSHSSSNTAFPRTGKRFYPTILAIRWVKSETASGRTRPAKIDG